MYPFRSAAPYSVPTYVCLQDLSRFHRHVFQRAFYPFIYLFISVEQHDKFVARLHARVILNFTTILKTAGISKIIPGH